MRGCPPTALVIPPEVARLAVVAGAPRPRLAKILQAPNVNNYARIVDKLSLAVGITTPNCEQLPLSGVDKSVFYNYLCLDMP
jgi:hypothetical protein